MTVDAGVFGPYAPYLMPLEVDNMSRMTRFVLLCLGLNALAGCWIPGDPLWPSSVLTVRGVDAWKSVPQEKAVPLDAGSDVQLINAEWRAYSTVVVLAIRNQSRDALVIDLKESTFVLEKRGRAAYGSRVGYRGTEGKPALLEEGSTCEIDGEKQTVTSSQIEVPPEKTATLHVFYSCNYVGKAAYELVMRKGCPESSFHYQFQLASITP